MPVIAAVFTCMVAALALGARAAQQQQPSPQAATLVLTNGRIVTMETAPAEVQALAIRGDRIAAVGSAAEIKRYIGQGTEVIDLKGQLAIPGFIESHGHFTGVGQAQLNLNLMKTTSWQEIVAMVGQAAKAAKPGEWIYGRGWHQEKWTAKPEPNVEGFPTHESLSRVSPNNPVLLTHASGHASFANAKAMELSGVSGQTPNPPGGDFLKDAHGNPTGLFL
jgi:predicted amidohydrolase YtcJ